MLAGKLNEVQGHGRLSHLALRSQRMASTESERLRHPFEPGFQWRPHCFAARSTCRAFA